MNWTGLSESHCDSARCAVSLTGHRGALLQTTLKHDSAVKGLGVLTACTSFTRNRVTSCWVVVFFIFSTAVSVCMCHNLAADWCLLAATVHNYPFLSPGFSQHSTCVCRQPSLGCRRWSQWQSKFRWLSSSRIVNVDFYNGYLLLFTFTVKNSYKNLFTFHSPAAGFVLLNRLRSRRQWLCLSGWIQTHNCTRQRAVLVYVRTHSHTKPLSQFWGSSTVFGTGAKTAFCIFAEHTHAFFFFFWCHPSKGTLWRFVPVCFSQRKVR